MHATITISSASPRASVEQRLAALTAAGPFRVRSLAPLDTGAWEVAFRPARPGMAIGFAKLAELLVLIAREFHIESMERISSGAAPAASSVPS
jgi:hypothetical protein